MKLPANKTEKATLGEKLVCYGLAFATPLAFFVTMFLVDDADRLMDQIMTLPLFIILGAGLLAIPLLIISLLIS